MKKIINFLLAIVSVSMMVTSCGTNPSTDGTIASKNSIDTVATVSKLSDPKVEGTFCFETIRKEGKDSFTCPLTIVIKNGKVTGNSPGDGYCGISYEGYQKGDTLFLKDSYEEPDGAVIITESLWLLQSDKLSQFETIDKNGHSVLKNPSNTKFILTYNKVNCK